MRSSRTRSSLRVFLGAKRRRHVEPQPINLQEAWPCGPAGPWPAVHVEAAVGYPLFSKWHRPWRGGFYAVSPMVSEVEDVRRNWWAGRSVFATGSTSRPSPSRANAPRIGVSPASPRTTRLGLLLPPKETH